MEIAGEILAASVVALLSLAAPNTDLHKTENRQLRISPTQVVFRGEHREDNCPENEFFSLVCPEHEESTLVAKSKGIFDHSCHRDLQCESEECEKIFYVPRQRSVADFGDNCLLISCESHVEYLPLCNSCNGPVHSFFDIKGTGIQPVFFCSKCHANNSFYIHFLNGKPQEEIIYAKKIMQKAQKSLAEGNFSCPTLHCKGKVRTASFKLDNEFNGDRVKLQFYDTCDQVPYTDKTAAKKVLLDMKISGKKIPVDIVGEISKFLPATKILKIPGNLSR